MMRLASWHQGDHARAQALYRGCLVQAAQVQDRRNWRLAQIYRGLAALTEGAWAAAQAAAERLPRPDDPAEW